MGNVTGHVQGLKAKTSDWRSTISRTVNVDGNVGSNGEGGKKRSFVVQSQMRAQQLTYQQRPTSTQMTIK